ncbi:ornithine carbamoyltransferase [Haladaptatus litoreus]|uniref:Ornithine carbamoyltransferase n=1 Tax=Haladaptatus litoreus TaxID=553468 RepID=A0A1N7BHC5_9EURY|nr:ornithine carbamoyltransferase [Haladaptatus litoreus]SIR50768.1 ornithine carbamoyltransferase [Haladaptatus litoreus]
MTRHFLDVDDLSPSELADVLSLAAEFKKNGSPPELSGQTLAMLFEKPSTRTRLSFETGMTQLGGHAVFMGPEHTHLDHGEPVSDTGRVLSRYVDFVMGRVFDHDCLVEMAEYATVPIINGLSDIAHPCQSLADLLTIQELVEAQDASEPASGHGPRAFEDVSVAWVGDGNNVLNSFAIAASTVGLDLTIATPEGYEPSSDALARASDRGHSPALTNDPEEAVADADVVYTDVWVSMGEEDEREEKLAAFDGFQLNEDLLPDSASVMHCLPAHRGEEITGDMLESDRSLAWNQAENRLHAQKALLAYLDKNG